MWARRTAPNGWRCGGRRRRLGLREQVGDLELHRPLEFVGHLANRWEMRAIAWCLDPRETIRKVDPYGGSLPRSGEGPRRATDRRERPLPDSPVTKRGRSGSNYDRRGHLQPALSTTDRGGWRVDPWWRQVVEWRLQAQPLSGPGYADDDAGVAMRFRGSIWVAVSTKRSVDFRSSCPSSEFERPVSWSRYG